MSYVNGLSFTKRRPSVRHVTGEEAVARLNQVIDDANAHIARAVAFAEHWQKVAADLEAENERLRARIAELEKEVKRLKPKLRPELAEGAGKKRWREV